MAPRRDLARVVAQHCMPVAPVVDRGSTGGVINQVSKQPFLSNQGSVTGTVGSDRYRRLTADVNRVIGQNVAIRLNAISTACGAV